MTSLLVVALGVGLHYLPISKSPLILIISQFLSGGVL